MLTKVKKSTYFIPACWRVCVCVFFYVSNQITKTLTKIKTERTLKRFKI